MSSGLFRNVTLKYLPYLTAYKSLLKKTSTGHISVSWKNMRICENNVSEMAG